MLRFAKFKQGFFLVKMDKTTFKKGHTPHNKGRRLEDYVAPEGIEKMKETQFKAGEEHQGENHVSWKGGVQQMTKDCAYVWSGNKQRIRRPRMVYEEHFGEVPKGHVIFHKDGDKDNDAPENLEAITRAELMRRNKGGSAH